MVAKLPAAERFWSKVDRGGPVPACRPDLGQCWIWMGAVKAAGYGVFRDAGQGPILAHRFAYATFLLPIPATLTIDHLCRNSRCVRPSHLEAVSLRENILRGVGAPAQHARQTHCVNGHPFDALNTLICRGRRVCRACRNARERLRRARSA